MGLKAIASPRFNAGLIAMALLGLVLVGVLTTAILTRDSGTSSTPIADVGGAGVVYIEFGATVDTVWRTSISNPKQRERLQAIEHGIGFGIVAGLSPDRSTFVYTSLASNLKAVAPDVPAQVWLSTLDTGAQPRQIADNADLLVKPIWSPDGSSIVFRRSTPESYKFVVVDARGTSERAFATSSDALFPIAFTPDGRQLYAARVRLDASALLAIDVATGAQREVGSLAPGLTRDWTLSPDGRSVAYLEMTQTGSDLVSRAFLIDTASGERRAASKTTGSDLSPVWSTATSVTIGQTQAGPTSEGVTSLADSKATTGFDVPLGWSPDGQAIAVRSFDGKSVLAPGNAALSILHSDGSHTILTNKEATFLGWTNF